MASPAHHSSTPWRRRYWQRRQSHDVLRNRTPSPRLGPRNVRAGTTFQHAHDWRPARPQPTTHAAVEPDADESRNAFVGFPKYTSECYNTVSLQSVTTRESFSPGASRGPPSRHSSHRSPSSLEPWIVSAVCLRLESRPHPRHPCPTDCDPFRQHSSRRARPNARPPRSRAPAFGFPSSALAAAPVPKRGPLRVAQYPACSVCLGQYVGVTGLCCSAQRRPGALTWPRAERTKPAAL